MERRIVAAWRTRLWQSVPRHGIGLALQEGAVGSEPLFPSRSRVVVCGASFDHLRVSRMRPVRAEAFHVVAAPDALPFATSRFDWAVSSLALCRTRRPSACILELRRLVRPGGLCCLLEAVRPTGWRGRLADLLSIPTGAIWHWFLNHDVAHALEAAGFRIERRLALWSDAVVVLVGRAPAREKPQSPDVPCATPNDVPVRVAHLTLVRSVDHRVPHHAGSSRVACRTFVSSAPERS